MTKIYSLILGLLIVFQGYSQLDFKSGYFINNENDTIKCFIKDNDWLNNPGIIKTRLKIDGPIVTMSIEDVKQFEINNSLLFIRSLVQIDTSSVDLSNLSKQRNPEWKEKLLFLKVLIKGKASLYTYQNGNLVRFFYSINQDKIIQLVYKQYNGKYNDVFMTNKYFCLQLKNDLNYGPSTDFEKLKYTERDLSNYFRKYNSSGGNTYIEYNNTKIKRKYIASKIAIGMNSSSLNVNNKSTDVSLSFEKKIGYELGVELEGILPFNNNKLRIVCLPTFQNYKSSTKYTISFFDVNYTADYKVLEFPIGFRNYFFLSNKATFYLTGLIVPSYNSKSSKIEIKSKLAAQNMVLEMKSKLNYAVGIGFSYNRYNFDIRYYTKRETLGQYALWSANYNNLSFIIGYTLF